MPDPLGPDLRPTPFRPLVATPADRAAALARLAGTAASSRTSPQLGSVLATLAGTPAFDTPGPPDWRTILYHQMFGANAPPPGTPTPPSILSGMLHGTISPEELISRLQLASQLSPVTTGGLESTLPRPPENLWQAGAGLVGPAAERLYEPAEIASHLIDIAADQAAERLGAMAEDEEAPPQKTSRRE